jgi:hypothetical protein
MYNLKNGQFKIILIIFVVFLAVLSVVYYKQNFSPTPQNISPDTVDHWKEILTP